MVSNLTLYPFPAIIHVGINPCCLNASMSQPFCRLNHIRFYSGILKGKMNTY